MKLLSTALLSIALVTSTTVSAITISPTLGDILNNTQTATDSGAQGIVFTDTDSVVDDSTFTLRLENSDNESSNSMGLYLYNTDTESQQTFGGDGLFELFDGDADIQWDMTNLIFDFDSKTITLETFTLFDESVQSSTVYGGSTSTGTLDYTSDLFSSIATLSFDSLEIGVYLDNGTDTFFSHDSLNTNNDPEGERMVGIFETSTGLTFAFEDNTDGLEWDFSDMVVQATDVALVPAPAMLAIFGLALLGLARRRKA